MYWTHPFVKVSSILSFTIGLSGDSLADVQMQLCYYFLKKDSSRAEMSHWKFNPNRKNIWKVIKGNKIETLQKK